MIWCERGDSNGEGGEAGRRMRPSESFGVVTRRAPPTPGTQPCSTAYLCTMGFLLVAGQDFRARVAGRDPFALV